MLEGGPWPSNRDSVERSQRLQQRNTENYHPFINWIKINSVTVALLSLTIWELTLGSLCLCIFIQEQSYYVTSISGSHALEESWGLKWAL